MATSRDSTFTYTFEAPRARVFEAFTSPSLLKRWFLSPPDDPGNEWEVCEVDLRVGGSYRWVIAGWMPGMTDLDRFECCGTYGDVLIPERLAFSLDVSNCSPPAERLMYTMEFAETRGATTIVGVTRRADGHDLSPDDCSVLWEEGIERLRSLLQTPKSS